MPNPWLAALIMELEAKTLTVDRYWQYASTAFWRPYVLGLAASKTASSWISHALRCCRHYMSSSASGAWYSYIGALKLRVSRRPRTVAVSAGDYSVDRFALVKIIMKNAVKISLEKADYGQRQPPPCSSRRQHPPRRRCLQLGKLSAAHE